jgi:hypothetical protein
VDTDYYVWKDVSDSEDEAPKRSRLNWRLAASEAEPQPRHHEDNYGISLSFADSEDGLATIKQDANATTDSSLLSHHQLAEQTDPDTAPHACRHCSKVMLDLRRQQANYVYRKTGAWADKRLIGLDVAAARIAASEGCILFSFLCRTADLNRPGAQERGTEELQITATVGMRHTPAVSFATCNDALGNLGDYLMYTVPGELCQRAI